MTLLLDVRQALVAAADPARAPAMQRYMKSTMPYHGVAAPLLRRIARELLVTVQLPNEAAYRAAVLELWRGATHREERYVAVVLARHRNGGKRFAAPTLVESLYEELIVTGAWWDLVDELAAHVIGDLVRRFPDEVKPKMRAWSRDPDLWKRRTSILCQIRSKKEMDVALLHECIEGSIGDKNFFARKAIGWALREHARFDADGVIAYVRANATRLAPLSKREALKAQLRDGTLTVVP